VPVIGDSKTSSIEIRALIDFNTLLDRPHNPIIPETHRDRIPRLSQLKTVAEEASDAYSRLSSLQLKVATAQPDISAALARLVMDSKERIETRIPAWQRSIEEILLTWSLS
jgi:type II secretory pathway predicted ATPase ExeA